MIEDLDLLANRLRQLAQLTQDLRTENRSLQNELARRDASIRNLQGTLATAQSRVDAVLARLPGAPSADDEVDAADPHDASPQPDDTAARSMHGTP